MSIVFDILHLTIAAVLAVIGVQYEREHDECPPVRLDPAAQVETLEGDMASATDVEIVTISECDDTRVALTYPAL